jgi:hypothetical protein
VAAAVRRNIVGKRKYRTETQKHKEKNNLTPRPGDPKNENTKIRKSLLDVLRGFVREKQILTKSFTGRNTAGEF